MSSDTWLGTYFCPLSHSHQHWGTVDEQAVGELLCSSIENVEETKPALLGDSFLEKRA